MVKYHFRNVLAEIYVESWISGRDTGQQIFTQITPFIKAAGEW